MSQRPLCFVLMPFGEKTADNGVAIDFNAIYQQIIYPAIEQAGLEPLRADGEMVDGIIHKPMFERLLLCQYAVADLTTANANVFYELGVRHAAKASSTTLIFAEGFGKPMFDVQPLRGTSYHLDAVGSPNDVAGDVARLVARLRAAREHATDSPLFQMVDGYPTAHELKTETFRSRVDYSAAMKTRLREARRLGVAALQGIEAELASAPGGLRDAEGGVMVDLFTSYRSVGAWDRMVALAAEMSRPLAATVLVRQQLALALNRHQQGEEAESVLQNLIQQHGVSSETQGILGRVYKDRWRQALAAGELSEARGALNKAIDAYLKGFEADWRDAYPGVNALTLMEMTDPPDPRRADLAPVVRYAVVRRIATGQATYWDHASALELAVLADDEDKASRARDDALAATRDQEDVKSTLGNLHIIAEIRKTRGKLQPWLDQIIAELARRSGVAP